MAKNKDSSRIWTIMSLVSGLLGATVARQLLNGGWRAATGKRPPANPADPDVAIGEAVAWAAVSGTAVALARMLVTRRAANYYVRSTGKLPPELEADSVRAARLAQAADDEARAEAAKQKKKKPRK